ncbi:hypothetical protein B0H10DRAFT_2231464 [Mycena sp. CBHHK59/15]|nr:hypothetical protein B0H10DRAFT_2231464 [Mycena sp. CBHHK59/15]
MNTIHEALLLRNMSNLPTLIRRFALAAAAGSASDLNKVCTLLDAQNIPLEQIDLFLPLFHSLLDPSSIPDGETLERIIVNVTEIPFINCAAMSLTDICAIAMKSSTVRDASPDHWPRVWPWIQFLHAYWQYLPGFPAAAELDAFIIHGSILLCLADHPGISGTVRLAIVTPTKPIMHLLLRTLAEDVKKNENVQEIVDGVGSYDELASLVVKQISLCVAYPEEQMRVLLVRRRLTLFSAPQWTIPGQPFGADWEP